MSRGVIEKKKKKKHGRFIRFSDAGVMIRTGYASICMRKTRKKQHVDV